LTGKERTLRALDFEPVDRAPIAGGLLQNAEYLARKAGRRDFWAAPRETAFQAFRAMGCDAVLGPVMPKRPEDTTRDAQGQPTDFTVSHAKPELTTPEQVAEHAQLQPSRQEVRKQFNFQQAYDAYLTQMQEGARDAGDMLYLPHCLGYAPNFPTSDGHFSYEAFLMACTLFTKEVKRLFDAWGEQSRLRCEAVAKATRDHDLLRLIWIGSDLCDANGPVLSPALFRELYFPQIARALEPLKEAGIRVVWHTDANYKQLVPDLLDLGMDGFQGLYETPAGVRLEDLAKTRTKAGTPPIIFGSVSTVWVLPVKGPDGVRQEIERCVEAVGEQGGLLLAPSSSIGPEVTAANVDAMYEHARRYVPSWRRSAAAGAVRTVSAAAR
jgi:flagellar motor protein MotB